MEIIEPRADSKMTIREAAVSGMFYPDDPMTLQTMVNTLLKNTSIQSKKFHAFIVPHAGYIYSGETAAHAYKQLESIKDKVKRVVILGPAHRVSLSGIAVSSADFFETPLGAIPLDKIAIKNLQRFPQIKVFDQAHAQEHSLEVHLPFLQTVLNDFSLLPLVVGDTDAESVAEVLEFFWRDSTDFSTVFIISSDLSHFHEYNEAKRIDRQTANAIMNLKPENISYEQACGRMPVNGLLTLAKKHHLKPTLLDIKNSGDTAGDRYRVVGYGAFGFE